MHYKRFPSTFLTHNAWCVVGIQKSRWRNPFWALWWGWVSYARSVSVIFICITPAAPTIAWMSQLQIVGTPSGCSIHKYVWRPFSVRGGCSFCSLCYISLYSNMNLGCIFYANFLTLEIDRGLKGAYDSLERFKSYADKVRSNGSIWLLFSWLSAIRSSKTNCVGKLWHYGAIVTKKMIIGPWNRP